MVRHCYVCQDEQGDGAILLRAPCGNHWICPVCVKVVFENATNNESLYPPNCCNQMYILQEWEEYLPFGTQWEYERKEKGEYAILPRCRVYCAHPPCAAFLHPGCYIEDQNIKTTYAICEADGCDKATCISCRTLLLIGIGQHECQVSEDEIKFKETANEKGYQKCSMCNSTIELVEACNHITCECGHQFCYICGKDWPGWHGCPQYGPATYDEEGYNQEGYHKETSLNRDGLTRHQQNMRERNEDEPNEEDEEDQEDPDEEVLALVDAETRAIINALDEDVRDEAIVNLRIQLHETQGVVFDQGQGQEDQTNDQDDVENDGEEDNVA